MHSLQNVGHHENDLRTVCTPTKTPRIKYCLALSGHEVPPAILGHASKFTTYDSVSQIGQSPAFISFHPTLNGLLVDYYPHLCTNSPLGIGLADETRPQEKSENGKSGLKSHSAQIMVDPSSPLWCARENMSESPAHLEPGIGSYEDDDKQFTSSGLSAAVRNARVEKAVMARK
jgi:hypothetical protein